MQSDQIKAFPDHAPARAMLRATGLTPADLEKPLIAVVSTFSEVTPCNMHLRDLAQALDEEHHRVVRRDDGLNEGAGRREHGDEPRHRRRHHAIPHERHHLLQTAARRQLPLISRRARPG